jgi:hypothetical protein
VSDAKPMPDEITVGEKYRPAMVITDQAEADAYFERCVEHTMRVGEVSRASAEHIERHNLGYYAGYYDNETRARVERLLRCAHPIFGAIAERGPPSAEQALRAGLVRGRRARERN